MDKAKWEGLLRLRLNGIFLPFNAYGMGVHIPGAIKQIMEMIKEFMEGK